MNSSQRHRVLIAGGGVAGLETAIALHELAGDRVEIAIRDPREQFVYRPFSVGAPFGAARISRYRLPGLAARCGAFFALGSIVSVDGGEHRAVTHDGDSIPYDHLVIAGGARLLPGVPGAVTFWGVDDEGGIAKVVAELRAGELESVVFTLPSGCSCSWALPVYELALFATAEIARGEKRDARVTIVTPEDAPLQLFGTGAGARMADLLAERRIEIVAGTHPVKFEDGRLQVAPAGHVEADAVVSLPRMEGRRIDGVPHDSEGFIAVDGHGRVAGMSDVFAAGDMTSFPIKQGGLAAQQADAVAEAIAAEIGCAVEPQPFDPVLRAVLWTGEEPKYLYGELSGGHGETSSLSDEPPWPGSEGRKIVARYLTPFLAAAAEEGPNRAGPVAVGH